MWNLAWKKKMSYFEHFPFETKEEVYELRLRVNVKGERIRILLSNEYGGERLNMDEISVSLDHKQYVPLTFTGMKECCVRPGQKRYSDPLSVTVDKGYIYFRIQASPQKIYTLGQTKDEELIRMNGRAGYYFGIERVEIDCDRENPLLCFFGDSLTDQGYFTSAFTKRLYEQTDCTSYNCGVSGNRMLEDADSESLWESSFGIAGIRRFESDVFGSFRPGIVIILIGINDLYHPGNGSLFSQLPSAEELKKGMESMIELCGKYHCACVPCTIPPFKGALYDGKEAWDSAREEIRWRFNSWIRSLDRLIDVDWFVRGTDPQRLKELYDSGDHLHFNKKGGHELGLYMYEYMEKMGKEGNYGL